MASHVDSEKSSTIDWDEFGTRKFSFTINNLAQHAAANVDVATVQIGRLICDQFKIPVKGDRNVSDAFNIGAGASAHPRGRTSPEAVAKALDFLATLSSGKVNQVQLIGTDDIGWLAAVAEWLLDMRVRINSASGQSLYCNCAGKDPQ